MLNPYNSDQNNNTHILCFYGLSWQELELVAARIALITQRSQFKSCPSNQDSYIDSKGASEMTRKPLLSREGVIHERLLLVNFYYKETP